jgi:hypothetical protein
MSKITDSIDDHKHEWRCFGSIESLVVCDGCNGAEYIADLIKQSQLDILERVSEGLVDKPENTFDEDYVNGWNNSLEKQREALNRIREEL